uniref:ShKT domain-containing protein n=1 Tax=Steinernema glaseri TaxID=37863 RepID=A0A1I8APB3_9BILA
MRTATLFLLFGFLILATDAVCFGNCCDGNPKCHAWAIWGECQISPNWMLLHCRASCGGCTSSGDLQCPFDQTVEENAGLRMTKEKVAVIIHKDGCAPSNLIKKNYCNLNKCYHQKYRSFDGMCNSLIHSDLGAAFTSFVSAQNSNYDDGKSVPPGTMKRNLPNPRAVTHHLLRSTTNATVAPNSLLMLWSQFVGDDMMMHTTADWCTCSDDSRECMNMLPARENVFRILDCILLAHQPENKGSKLIRTRRSSMRLRYTSFGFMQLWRVLQIYGSDIKTAESLRKEGKNAAFLKATMVDGRMFPPHPNGKFVVGSDRAKFAFNGLGALYTIFLRLHNRLAEDLGKINRGWDPDRLFQETRKIVGAYMQVITYREFLPALLGPDFSSLVPPYSYYTAAIPTVAIEFVGATFRLHGLIMPSYPMRDTQWRKTDDWSVLSKDGDIHVVKSGTDAIIRGLISTSNRAPQSIAYQLTDEGYGLGDIGSLNIQIGRDHGFQPYNKFRKHFGLPLLTSFNEWFDVHDNATRELVRRLYHNNPDNIDLYVGGTVEEPEPGRVVGPIFATIIGDQFTRTRNGDRFYYENPDIFTPEQVRSLKRVSLANVLCLTGENISAIVPDAFRVDDGSRAIPCEKIRSINLELWKDPLADLL